MQKISEIAGTATHGAHAATPAASDMSRLIAEKNWALTNLGPIESWPRQLRSSLQLILASGFPMVIRWGPKLCNLYNDAYVPIFGDKHPQALGQPVSEVWPEIFDNLGPIHLSILRGERPSFFETDKHWRVKRHAGAVEDAYFTVNYSAIHDEEAENGIGGVLVVVTETTREVERAKRFRDLNERLEEEVAERTRERERIWQVSEDLLGVSNFDGYFPSVNPAWNSLLGWSADELPHMHVSELRHPDDAEDANAQRERLAQGVPTVRMENRFRHKDGSW